MLVSSAHTADTLSENAPGSAAFTWPSLGHPAGGAACKQNAQHQPLCGLTQKEAQLLKTRSSSILTDAEVCEMYASQGFFTSVAIHELCITVRDVLPYTLYIIPFALLLIL